MNVIIAEKPSVARAIASIVGATTKQEGYLEGNGYAVTWALGHLVTLAMPEAYGIKGFRKECLPILPPVFTIVPRQVKVDKGYKPDSGALAQLKVIKKLFSSCSRIIVATDAGREGELIFRYIYEYLGCAKPFDRLWISSLTDKAIREGLQQLKCGAAYDNLYYAARARSEADWLVGINATQAVTIAAGRGTYSLGRVQTPTLGMVCSRFIENREFSPQKYWRMSLSVEQGDDFAKFSSIEQWSDKQTADTTYGSIKEAALATVVKVECREKTEEPPLLYDLTTLQKEANTKHGFSADKTLTIAQTLYEAKLTTYPRTGSRYISDDVFAEIPALVGSLKSNPRLGAYAKSLTVLNPRPVNDKKVTDHHAILITGVRAKELSSDEQIIYDMVATRMLEAFSDKCIKDVTTLTVGCCDTLFTLKGSIIKQSGWRGVLGEADENDESEGVIPTWAEGDSLIVKGCSLSEGVTNPKPLHTESSLLSAMETCSKDIEDEELRAKLKDCGIGTPATRAAIIETLIAREYMVRIKKSLVPTEKGIAIYSIVKPMRIADTEMTGQWEAALAKIESGEMKDTTFRKAIEVYASQVTAELLDSRILFPNSQSEVPCPKCGKGSMQFLSRVARCNNEECALPVFRMVAGKQLTDALLTELLTKGKTATIKGFTSKTGKSFDAALSLDEDFKTNFVFAERKKR